MIYYLNFLGEIIEANDLGPDKNGDVYKINIWFYNKQDCEKYIVS